MGFGGFRRSYWKNIFSQLEKYFFPSGKKTELCETCKTCSPPHTHARAYNKVNFDFQLARSITFQKKIKLSSIIYAACKTFTKRHRLFYSLSKKRDNLLAKLIHIGEERRKRSDKLLFICLNFLPAKQQNVTI